jgi:hypothetical protein
MINPRRTFSTTTVSYCGTSIFILNIIVKDSSLSKTLSKASRETKRIG